MHDASGGAAGFVVVVDDVTEIMRVQRMAAWREMARRIAHEIKNPLTPIQLSAQRLRRKLAGKLADPESAALLRESDRRDHRRGRGDEAPARRVLELRAPAGDRPRADRPEQARRRGGRSCTAATPRSSSPTELDPAVPMLDLDRQQIRRVILNLIDNAVAAIDEARPGARAVRGLDPARRVGRHDPPAGRRHRRGHPRPRTARGSSSPASRPSARARGSGLAIVSRIVSDHSGYVRVAANRPRGSRFIVELPVRAEVPWPRS